jgi:hypothetical protein
MKHDAGSTWNHSSCLNDYRTENREERTEGFVEKKGPHKQKARLGMSGSNEMKAGPVK